MIEIGQRLVIKGDWDTSPTPAGRTPVIIKPSFKSGMGYQSTGFGYEPSTQAFLIALEGRDLAGKTVFDIGCGTGILGLAAARLGATRVHCTDLSLAALDAARANVAENGLDAVVSVEDGTIPTTFYAADLVLCNVDPPAVDPTRLIDRVLALKAPATFLYRRVENVDGVVVIEIPEGG